jgi:4-diphosphocytidyl-2-C-methyl-D-erythritol kinase
MRALAVPAHAMLNLDLKVHGLLPDGRHEIESAMQAISLHDLLVVEPASTASLEGGYGDDDLVTRARRALEAAAGRSLPARMRLVKRIPAGAGLSGGSSDAAATLRALSRLHGLDLDLAPVAAGLGADVPFFLRGGAATARGAGEVLSPRPPIEGWAAIAWTGLAVSTADVYRMWDAVGGDGGNHLQRPAHAVEPRLADFAGRLGGGWRMTGSGSAHFRLAETRAESASYVAALDCLTAVARPLGPWSW